MRHFKYSMFEILILVFGVGTVIALVLVSPWEIQAEVVAELLLIPILVGVLHYGYKGGLVAFSLATMTYLMIRMPDIIRIGLVTPVLRLLSVRILSYAVVGIGGGFICSRIKYFFAGSKEHDSVDDVTGLFGPDYLGWIINKYVGQHERHKKHFAVIIIAMDDQMFGDLRDERIKKELKAVGSIIRSNVRAIDDAGRISDSEFCLVCPFTSISGATRAGSRLQLCVVRYLKKQKYSAHSSPNVRVEIIGFPEDQDRLLEFMNRLGIQTNTSSKRTPFPLK